jgi:hypothetical protein
MSAKEDIMRCLFIALSLPLALAACSGSTLTELPSGEVQLNDVTFEADCY